MMAILFIARKSLRQHAMATAITAFSIALASGLAMSVWSLSRTSYRAFTGGSQGFDAVLGARGSQLQLVLNSVFHLDTSPGNIPWLLYEKIKADPRVRLALPYAVGDSFRGFRIVGTTDEMFTVYEPGPGQHLEIHPGGHPFDPWRQEAVIGSTVARRTGLSVGSTFHPSHGISADDDDPENADETEQQHHEEEYVVTGVLEPTGTPIDRVIWIPIEGLFRLGGHVLRGNGEPFTPAQDEDIPDEHKEVSAVMLKLQDPLVGFQLAQEINRGAREATLAWPIGRVMAELFDRLGWMNRILSLVALLTIIVATAASSAAIFNSLNGRRREIAILRSLGARRSTIFGAIVAESAAIAAIGCTGGYLAYGAILSTSFIVIREKTGVHLDLVTFDISLVWVPLLVIMLGSIAGLLPAVRAYQMDVADGLDLVS